MRPDAEDAFGNMAFAQRYRDAHLADALLKAADKQTRGPARRQRSRPHRSRRCRYYLRQRAPERKVVTVMLVEVEDGKTDPQAYVPRDPDGKPAADYVVLTPRQNAPIPARPCARA